MLTKTSHMNQNWNTFLPAGSVIVTVSLYHSVRCLLNTSWCLQNTIVGGNWIYNIKNLIILFLSIQSVPLYFNLFCFVSDKHFEVCCFIERILSDAVKMSTRFLTRRWSWYWCSSWWAIFPTSCSLNGLKQYIQSLPLSKLNLIVPVTRRWNAKAFSSSLSLLGKTKRRPLSVW